MHFNPNQIKSLIRSALTDQALRAAVLKATDHSTEKRNEVVSELNYWEELREQAAIRRDLTLAKLDDYLLQLEEKAASKGIQVHWAKNGEEANRLIGEICKESTAGKSGRPIIAKSKSMTTEEIGLTPYLQALGYEVVETDLGEYIVQIAGQMPSHITAPALHLSRQGVGKLFVDKLGVEYNEDPVELIGIARKVLREKFLKAEIGITGANFAVAETGTPMMVENEGNGRLVSAVPETQIIVMGFDKVVRSWDDLMIYLELLPRSATGQRITGSVLFFNRPRLPEETDGPKTIHLVILDNGRTKALADPDLRSILRCIRCGACLNVCPVYRRTGGHAYGWVYPGPIGSVLAPIYLGLEEAKDHAFASSLCGKCTEFCPVKIPLHHQLLTLRSRVAEQKSGTDVERLGFILWKAIMDRPELYQAISKLPRFILFDLMGGKWQPRIPIWGREHADLSPAQRTFTDLFNAEFKSDIS